jgi:hypothetical protein
MRNGVKATLIVGGIIAATLFFPPQKRDRLASAPQTFGEAGSTVQHRPVVATDAMRPNPSMPLTRAGQ